MFFVRLLQQLPAAVSLGFLWGVMTLGVYMTYRILDFADLTVDGSFAFGGATAASLIVAGLNPFVATFVAFSGASYETTNGKNGEASWAGATACRKQNSKIAMVGGRMGCLLKIIYQGLYREKKSDETFSRS